MVFIKNGKLVGENHPEPKIKYKDEIYIKYKGYKSYSGIMNKKKKSTEAKLSNSKGNEKKMKK